MRKPSALLPITAILFWCIACGNSSTAQRDATPTTDTINLSYTVEDAPEWTGLFDRTSGWFGADGIFTIPLHGVDTPQSTQGSKTLLVFSDTMIGEIEDGELQPGSVMINNSVATLDGTTPDEDRIQFFWDSDSAGKPTSVFVPQTPQTQPGEYYWLGDGFVNQELDNTTYVFGYRIRHTDAAVFPFEEVGNTLIAIPAGSQPPFKDHRQMDTPFFIRDPVDNGNNGSFGAGIFVNTIAAGAPDPDGYVYVYGVRGPKKHVLVARVAPKDFEHFTAWRFWDGAGWNIDIDKAAPIADRASNELSVTPLPDGRYALVFQTDGIGTSVGLRIGLSPAGPFGPIKELWDCPEVEQKGLFVYNAKAHFNLSEKNELLISYNVNSFDFLADIKKTPNLYRPRFIRVKFK
ncbi:DUF4185 domain-containing protein [Parapedobacter soli]|uniref:DUF4185 domain-containing protein n=1 Tax=Parapedobacter soli TaxID=416955 RepID=UPI0021C7F8B9|nr:DUF4185 domain-containing protein [Parapedobacter soli]